MQRQDSTNAFEIIVYLYYHFLYDFDERFANDGDGIVRDKASRITRIASSCCPKTGLATPRQALKILFIRFPIGPVKS